MSVREAIKTIVLAGGIAQFPFKRGLEDWFGEVKVGQLQPYHNKPLKIFVHWPCGMDNFDTLDEAIEFVIKTVFTRKNLALAYEGIKKRRMNTKDFDDMDKDEIKALIKKYNDEFFDIDHPKDQL